MLSFIFPQYQMEQEFLRRSHIVGHAMLRKAYLLKKKHYATAFCLVWHKKENFYGSHFFDLFIREVCWYQIIVSDLFFGYMGVLVSDMQVLYAHQTWNGWLVGWLVGWLAGWLVVCWTIWPQNNIAQIFRLHHNKLYTEKIYRYFEMSFINATLTAKQSVKLRK